MENPCKRCQKADPVLLGEAFEPRCASKCTRFDAYVNEASERLDALLAKGDEILRKHGVELKYK